MFVRENQFTKLSSYYATVLLCYCIQYGQSKTQLSDAHLLPHHYKSFLRKFACDNQPLSITKLFRPEVILLSGVRGAVVHCLGKFIPLYIDLPALGASTQRIPQQTNAAAITNTSHWEVAMATCQETTAERSMQTNIDMFLQRSTYAVRLACALVTYRQTGWRHTGDSQTATPLGFLLILRHADDSSFTLHWLRAAKLPV